MSQAPSRRTPDLAVRYTQRVARPRQIQNSVLGAVIAAELIFLIGHPLFGWGPHRRSFVVTPPALTLNPPAPPSGRGVLESLAAVAAQQPAPAVHRYGYVNVRSWVWTRQRTSPRPDYPRYELVSTWTDAHGTGRFRALERTADGFHADRPASATPLATDDPASSATRLATVLGPRSQLAAVSQFGQFAALAARRPIAPATEARLLRRLADDSGVVNAGTTHDRQGRRGVAVSTSGDSQRLTLVFDPSSGRLLEADTQLVTAAPQVDVPAGGLLSYRVLLGSGWVARMGQVPSGQVPSG